jgi:hypothetical protein
MEKKDMISRRMAVAGIGAGIAGLAVTPAFAGGYSFTPENATTALEDPTTKYQGPLFRPQQQPFPGLAN